MQKEYNPVSCDHKLDNGFTAWMFQSEEQGNFPGTGFKVFVHVCKNCGEISVGGRREDSHGKVNYFDEHFDIHHPDAIDAIIKQANFYNEEVKWQRVPAPPASAEEEAEKLYPKEIVIGKENSDRFTFNQLAEMQRSAHITCAGMYTGEIEKAAKKAKIELLWELIEDWQASRDIGEDIHAPRFSYNDIEADLYEWMEKIDLNSLKAKHNL